MSEETQKQLVRPTQEEAGYVPLSGKKGQACASCRWFHMVDGLPGCHLIENYPADILPTGWCERWEGIPAPPEPPVQAPLPVVLVEAEYGSMETDKAGRMFSSANASGLKKAWENVKAGMSALTDLLTKAGLFEESEDDEKALKERGSTFTVFKAKDGKFYWKAVWSNDFQDRDGEIISSKAHQRYLSRLDAGLVPLPDLYYWHLPAFKHGKALYVTRAGHMMVAFGAFDDTPLAQAMIAHYRKEKKKVSHGFQFPKWALKDGIYEDYNTFEISPLPPDVAANPYTGFEEITNMGLTDQQKAHMEAILGKELLAETLAKTEQVSKALEDAGIAFKDFADVPGASEVANEGGQPTLGKMLLSLIEAQGKLLERQDAQQKAFEEQITANRQQLEALEAKNKALEDMLAMTPRASLNPQTVVENPDLLKQVQEKSTQYDDFFRQFDPDFKVPKPNGAT